MSFEIVWIYGERMPGPVSSGTNDISAAVSVMGLLTEFLFLQ